MKCYRFLAGLIPVSLVAAALFSSPAGATWEEGGYPLCTATNCQANPRLIADGMGGAFICWDDKRGGMAEDLYAQHLNADGDPYWQPQGVPFCTADNSQYWPRIIRDGSGGIILVWQDLRKGTNTDLYARRIDASGNPVWTAGGVAICTKADEQQYPRIVPDGAGGAIIAWQDCRTTIDNDIFAQRINAQGSVAWISGGVQVCQLTYSEQEKPGIVPDGLGGAIIIWQDMRSNSYDIYAQRIDATGAPLWATNGVPVCSADGDQLNLRAVPDGIGGAIVAWEDWRSGNAEMYIQRVNILGNAVWAAGGVRASSSSSKKTWADLTGDGIGGAILVWDDGLEGGEHNIVAQRFDAGGAAQWGEAGATVCGAAGYQHSPCLVSDEMGGAIVVWQDRRFEYGGDIYAQRVSAAGNVLWTPDGVGISVVPGSETSAELVSDGLGGAIIAWVDARYYTNTDVYVQRIDSNGQLIGIGDEAPRPHSFLLEQNFPNPFNPATVIRFGIARPGPVKLAVFDVSGRPVRALVDEPREAGTYQVSWDGRDEQGSAVASGVYLYVLEAPGYNDIKKMVLLR